MRIVFTSDTHYPFSPDLIPNGDVLIHCGDLMYSGQPDEWYPRLESLKSLDHKTKLILPGNHDFHMQNYMGVARAELRKVGFKMIGLENEPCFTVGGLKILGLPFVTGLYGWAFNKSEDDYEDYLENLGLFGADVVVSHAPVFNILDAIRPDQSRHRDQEHVGTLATNRWFYQLVEKKTNPRVWACGHIHESYGRANVSGTQFLNVAMCDRDYKQVNPGMYVDL